MEPADELAALLGNPKSNLRSGLVDRANARDNRLAVLERGRLGLVDEPTHLWICVEIAKVAGVIRAEWPQHEVFG